MKLGEVSYRENTEGNCFELIFSLIELGAAIPAIFVCMPLNTVWSSGEYWISENLVL